ncbi:MAG: hypothetical protein GY810_14780 [Aureispira sp.]|nr:hypothetical protein [Aureispira sp.]
MKALSFLLMCVLMSTLTFAQETESDKTLVKTLDPEGCQDIRLDFESKNIEANPWDEGTMRVELEISANMPEAILAQLVKAGRYSLDAQKDGETYIVSAPNLGKTVTIRGKDLEENIKVVVKTPGYFALADNTLSKNINEEVVAARTDDPAKAKDMIKKMRAIKEKMDFHVNVTSTLKGNAVVDLKEGDILIDGEPLKFD